MAVHYHDLSRATGNLTKQRDHFCPDEVGPVGRVILAIFGGKAFEGKGKRSSWHSLISNNPNSNRNCWNFIFDDARQP